MGVGVHSSQGFGKPSGLSRLSLPSQSGVLSLMGGAETN